MFSALRLNSLIYILDKSDTPTLKKGLAISVTAPRPKVNGFYVNPTDMVVDINVTVSDILETFKNIPANLSVVNDGNIVISETREAMCLEVEGMLTTSKQVLDSMSYHQKAVGAYEIMLKELNPLFAKAKLLEEKISNLETKMGSIEASIGDMKQMLSLALNKTV